MKFGMQFLINLQNKIDIFTGRQENFIDLLTL